MTATYTFDVFSSLDGYGSYAPPGDWGGYWGKQGPDLLDHRLALFGNEQRMVFGATTFRQFVSMLASSTEDSEVRDPWGHPDEEHAGNGGVDDAGRSPRLAKRDRREWRRRRRRRPPQGGVWGAVALSRQPVDEPGADGRRPRRPRPGDDLPGHHRTDRSGPDLPGCGRLRPGADRAPDPRRSHPGARLPTHPPLTRKDFEEDHGHGRPQLGEQRDEGGRGERVGRSRKALFIGVRRETVWKLRGEHDVCLRSALWRARDTPRICPIKNPLASALIFPNPPDKVAPNFMSFGLSST